MANCSQTYPLFNTANFKIERGDILDESKIGQERYKRFLLTDSGVSPRVLLGTKNGIHWYTGDEHNEFGHISEEPENRIKMMDKRMKKLELVDSEVPLEEKVNFFGDKESENIIVSWGSPKGAILEAMEMLRAEGVNLGFMQLRMLLPLPKKYLSDILKPARKIIDVEGNYLGQLAGVLKEEVDVDVNYYVLKYTGRPITSTEMFDSLKNIIGGHAEKRQVLHYGS
jgi:2-oxoglutarate ferredoxin oxidoreductase subunit alpha